MNEHNEEPFLCVDVDNFNDPLNMAKRFEELFPKRIIRLRIDNKYTPIFYLGDGVWIYNNFSKKSDINYKICLEESKEDFFNEEILEIIKYFNINYDDLKILTNLVIKDFEFHGFFFSDGNNHIFDQFIFDNCHGIKTLLEKHLNATTIIDATNHNEEGFVILNTQFNLFGDINGKSNTEKQ